MKSGITALALLAVLGLGAGVYAADNAGNQGGQSAKHEGHHKGVHGKVQSTSAAGIVIKTRDGKEVTVKTDDKTKFTKDGKPALASDVKPGETISATPETGTATEVRIHTGSGRHTGAASHNKTASGQ